MKTILQWSALLVLLALLPACRTRSSIEQVITPDMVRNTLSGQTWKISWYINSGQDQSSAFDGAQLSFMAGGQVQTSWNGGSETGTWNAHDDGGAVKLNLNLSPTIPLSQLNDDWRVWSRTDHEIKLVQDNSGTPAIEYLTIVRN